MPIRDETGEVDRQPGCLAFQPGAQRTLASDDQSSVDAGVTQCGECVDAAVSVLFHRQPAAVDQQDLRRGGPVLPNPGTAPPRVEGLQVYAQWDGDGICRSDAVEFFAREPGSTHDSVVVGGGSRVGEVCELLRGSTRKHFVAAIPECRANPVCSVAQEVVQWANTVTESCAKLADAAGQLARGIADVASATSGVSGLPNALDGIGGQLAQVRESAAGVQELLNNVGAAPLRELPDYLRELAAVSQSAPGVDLYAARRILTDPNMRAVLDYFVSPNGHATRLLVYGDGSEWGDDGAQRARAIVTAVAEETDEGTLRPTAVELTGVGPATRDLQDLVGSDLTLLAVITLAVIFAIAALLLRSPLAGLVVVGTIATSYICALGASVVIWKHILGDNLHWSVLPIAFVLLISVGSAYNLLFALRIREESPAGPRTSVIRAFAATGMVVTAAGIVFGTTMFALAASTSLSVAQIGVTVGMGLLLDALVIRGFVLPALMVLLGRWLWWPRRSVSNRQVPEPSPA